MIELANKLKPNSQVGVNAALDGYKSFNALPDEESEAIWVCDSIQHILNLKKHPEIEAILIALKLLL